MKNSLEVEKIDLSYIIKKSDKELKKLANKKLLITGGAGFLGYYFIKSIVNWNENNDNHKIELIICSPKLAFSPDRGTKTPILIFVFSENEILVLNIKNMKSRILKKLFIL